MRKPISQKDARAAFKQVADLSIELGLVRANFDAAKVERDKLDAENTRLAVLVAQKEKALAAGMRLGGHRFIALWEDAPKEVLAAIAVATHLGRVVVFERDTATRWNEHGLQPEAIEVVNVHAYEKL